MCQMTISTIFTITIYAFFFLNDMQYALTTSNKHQFDRLIRVYILSFDIIMAWVPVGY